MGDRGTRRRGVIRDRWLRRLRRTGVAVPVAGAVAATGLAAMLARHDSATEAAATNRSSVHTTPTPTTSATRTKRDADRGNDDDGRRTSHAKKSSTTAPKPSLTSGGTSTPVTHSGGS